LRTRFLPRVLCEFKPGAELRADAKDTDFAP